LGAAGFAEGFGQAAGGGEGGGVDGAEGCAVVVRRHIGDAAGSGADDGGAAGGGVVAGADDGAAAVGVGGEFVGAEVEGGFAVLVTDDAVSVGVVEYELVLVAEATSVSLSSSFQVRVWRLESSPGRAPGRVGRAVALLPGRGERRQLVRPCL